MALNAARVRYLVVGGMAAIIHGVPRTTVDLDLVIALDRENVLATVKAIESLGYCPRAPVKASLLADEITRSEWVRQKGMKAFSFRHTTSGFREIDLLVDHPVDFEMAWSRARMEKSGDVDIPVASIEDLVALKQGTGRAQDEDDIRALERIRQLGGG